MKEKMLTRHNAIIESHLEGIPINLVTGEDGQTLLAVTEHKDGVLEIVAAPITFIGHNGTTASLVDPVLQISLEGIVNGAELLQQRSMQTFEIQSDNITDQIKLQSCVEEKDESIDTLEYQLLPENNLSAAKKNEETCKQNSKSPTVKRSRSGRPKKGATSSLQGIDSLKCDICHQEFFKQALYRKHMDNHAEEKPHRCPKCSASFNVPTNFTLHMATHSTGEPKCPECGKKFVRMASLKSHMLLHEKEEHLFCTECEDAFSTKAQLDAHLKLHGEKWTIEEVRKCKLCHKQFSQPVLYKLHIREHYRLQTKVAKQTKRGTKQKTMYKCSICLKAFQKPSQLMRHIRVHTGEKPFKCTVCGRAFTQKSSLQIHTWQHNGIRPHACELCNAKFSQKGNLNAHIMRVHNVPEGEPMYKCTYCSCVFKKLGSLNGHIKRMHTNANEESNLEIDNTQSSSNVEDDIRATVDNVMTQLALLESGAYETTKSSNFESCTLSENITKKDILQQALKNSGLPSKNKTVSEGALETKKSEARTHFVTLLDRAPDGGTRKYLTIKQRCVGNVRWYACTFCHKEFKKPSDLIRHLRVHTQEKPFKCTFCYRSFALKSTMIAHERTHSSVKKYACNICDKTFVCHGSLVTHSRLHRLESVDKDKDVATASQPKAQAKNKPKLSHEAESLVPQVVLQEPLVISDTGNEICVAQVSSKDKRIYENVADSARPHKCLVCQAAFRKISHLKQHHRRHTGERPYKCTKCDRTFTSNSVLKSHLHTHEDSRPHGCSICNAKFSTQSSMKRHLVTHSNKRPFMCPYCHKTFKTYVNCRKHMKIHKYELVQRQLEEQKVKAQEETLDKSSFEENSEQVALEPSCSSISIAAVNSTTSNISVSTANSTTIVATSSSSLLDNLAASRLRPIQLSFQPQEEFSQTFSEFQSTEKKEGAVSTSNCDIGGTTFVNENVSDIAVMNVENSQMLHTDEAGSVTLPVYPGDRALTPESIREIEETLNQQFFSIGMNLNLGGSNSRHSNDLNTCEISDMKEQQPMLNVMYENENSNNISNNVETDGHVFSSQLDSFEMDQIALQSDGNDHGIGLDAGDNSTDMAGILARSAKHEHQLSICVPTSSNVTDVHLEKSSMQAVVFISQENFQTESTREGNELPLEETDKSNDQCTIDSIFLTEDFREASQNFKVRSTIEEAVKAATTESLLQCHMCSQQGFTAIGLKEHLISHRYSGTKEYQCTECSVKFYANSGSNKHSKTRVVKRSLKCPSCEKRCNDTVETRSNIHQASAMWNVATSGIDAKLGEPISDNQSPLHDIVIDADSTVSEKVLLDTVAEKEVMNRIENILAEKEERKEYTNKCKYCPKTFRKPSDLIRHVRTHTGERPYKCDYCGKSFAVKCTLDSHTKVHTGKKTFRCHVCSSLFATKGSLKVHMRLHTGSKPFRCLICDLRFRTSGHKKVHLLKHAREYKDGNPKRKQKHSKVAVIAQVAADFEKQNNETMKSVENNRSELKEQQTTLTTDLRAYNITEACLSDQINLDTDDIISNNNQAMSVSINETNQLVTNLHFFLTNDIVTVQTEESLPSQSFASLTADNSHPDSQTDDGKIHLEQALKISSNNCLLSEVAATSITPSEEMTQVPEDKSTMDKSIKKNSSKKECDICGKVFTKPYQVERHKRIHTGERPYKCDLCTKSFAQKSTLQMHQKHHTGDRPYACPHCEYSFTQKGNLGTHVKRFHQLGTVESKKWKRARRSSVPKSSFHESTIEAKDLNLDDISFVEFLK